MPEADAPPSVLIGSGTVDWFGRRQTSNTSQPRLPLSKASKVPEGLKPLPGPEGSGWNGEGEGWERPLLWLLPAWRPSLEQGELLPHSWRRSGDGTELTHFRTKSLEKGSEIGSVNSFKKPDYQI